MELKKFIAEHKEEIIGKTDTPIIEIPPKIPDIYRVNQDEVIISQV